MSGRGADGPVDRRRTAEDGGNELGAAPRDRLCAREHFSETQADRVEIRARVVRLQVDVYGGSGCSASPEPREATGDSDNTASGGDNLGSPTYSRTDGCGFDAYGRWQCG